MEKQKTSNSQSDLEKEEWNWRNQDFLNFYHLLLYLCLCNYLPLFILYIYSQILVAMTIFNSFPLTFIL